MSLSVSLSVCLSVCLPACLSACLFVYLSTCLPVSAAMSLSVEGWVVAEDARGALCLRPILGAMFTPVEMHLNGSTVAVQPRWSAAGDTSALLKLRLDQLYTPRTIVVSKSLGV